VKKAVFIPGLLCTEALYAPQIEALRGRLDIAVADHRRHATMRDIASHILSGAPERFVLAGLSMGGYISFEIMRQAADRVEALILLDTSARPDVPEKTEARKRQMALAAEQGIAPVIEELLPAFIAEERLGDDALTGTIRRMAEDTGPDAFARQQAAIMTRPDSRPALAGISCPALVGVGEKDVLTPPELAREIARAIPGATLEIIPDCGHIATLEQPEAVNAAIIGFLDGAGITG
jgi:pimeloyl-ACP methyl ester carboxylesterase